MKIIDFLRLIRKHLVLLIVIPLFLSMVVLVLTRHPKFTFSSETILYTGIASGTTVEMDKTFNFFATNTAFDNLINIIKSRETQQEVGLRLLALHLMLPVQDPKYISRKNWETLQKLVPVSLHKLIAPQSRFRKKTAPSKVPVKIQDEDFAAGDTSGISDNVPQVDRDFVNIEHYLPTSIDPEAYEKTVNNLSSYMAGNDTNFVYKLLNFTDPHYSIKAISSITVLRIGSSDLVSLKYDSDDPGICQQTLLIFTEVCIKNYKQVKENRSDAVVKYFEDQVRKASDRLKLAEDKLLQFNEDNNIINYYEQSKAIAVTKQDLDADYNNKRIRLAGLDAAIKGIEEKLQVQEHIQIKSTAIVDRRNELAELNTKILTAETMGSGDTVSLQQLSRLKQKAEKLKDELRVEVNDMYRYGHTTEGLPLPSLLSDWITNVIDYENTKAGLQVQAEHIKDFQKEYAIYAPAGANLKRIERGISVSEQEFLELVHGLNMAKLKMQDIELSSNIKAIDRPFYPLSPNPTKRKILIIVAGFVGFILVLGLLLVMEYFDDTLRNQYKAEKTLNLKPIGIFPKILMHSEKVNFPFITNRLLEMMVQQFEFEIPVRSSEKGPRTILIFSMLSQEGKTVLANNLAGKLRQLGKKVAILKYSKESLKKTETSGIGYSAGFSTDTEKTTTPVRLNWLARLLGYQTSQIDNDSPFLGPTSSFLPSEAICTYQINETYYSCKSAAELAGNNGMAGMGNQDYYLVEIPSVLYYPLPADLVASADLAILVARSNRVWSPADQGSLETVLKQTHRLPMFLLNGVDLQVCETVIGELPKKRSRFRRILKKVVYLQFFDRYQT